MVGGLAFLQGAVKGAFGEGSFTRVSPAREHSVASAGLNTFPAAVASKLIK